MTPDISWLLIAYVTGTIFGLVVGYKVNAQRIVEMTVDSLIEQGFLKTRRDASGNIEILPFNKD